MRSPRLAQRRFERRRLLARTGERVNGDRAHRSVTCREDLTQGKRRAESAAPFVMCQTIPEPLLPSAKPAIAAKRCEVFIASLPSCTWIDGTRCV